MKKGQKKGETMRKSIKIVFAVFLSLQIFFTGISMDAFANTMSEKDKLSIFLSNFAETHMESFGDKTVTDAELIDFAVCHVYLNHDKKMYYGGVKLKTTDNSLCIPEKVINTVILRFFNKKVSLAETPNYKFEEGYFIAPFADGGYAPMTKAEKIRKLSKDTYEVSGTTYAGFTSFFTAKDIVKSVEQLKKEYEAAGFEWYGAESKITAKVKKLKDRYILLDYKIEKIK